MVFMQRNDMDFYCTELNARRDGKRHTMRSKMESLAVTLYRSSRASTFGTKLINTE